MIAYAAVFFALLSLALGTAVVILWRKTRLQERQMAALRAESRREHPDSIRLRLLREMLWRSVNTIHLLAALTEEESSAEERKDNQRMILAECGKIQQQL